MKADAQFAVRGAVDSDDLAGLRLFAGADLDLAASLLENCPVRVLHTDEVLLTPGAANQTLYLVLGGRLRVHLDSPETDPVRRIGTGEAVGEVSLIDEKPTSAYVMADSPTSILVIDQKTFWVLVKALHAVAHNMLLMVVERMRANNALAAEGMRLREHYHLQTNVDELTGLRNRLALEDLLRRQLLRSSMNRKPLTLLTVDIDNFQDFNREFGRAAGDHALYAVAHTLQDQVRPTDIVARLGGEKFGIILPDSDESGACVVAARLRETVAEAVVVMADESILPSVTVSVGIAEMRPFDTAEALLEAADVALRRAKNNGGNTLSN